MGSMSKTTGDFERLAHWIDKINALVQLRTENYDNLTRGQIIFWTLMTPCTDTNNLIAKRVWNVHNGFKRMKA